MGLFGTVLFGDAWFPAWTFALTLLVHTLGPSCPGGKTPHKATRGRGRRASCLLTVQSLFILFQYH